jgi:hypothetical protein
MVVIISSLFPKPLAPDLESPYDGANQAYEASQALLAGMQQIALFKPDSEDGKCVDQSR